MPCHTMPDRLYAVDVAFPFPTFLMKNAVSSLVVFVGSFCFIQSIVPQRHNAIMEGMRSTAPWRMKTKPKLIA